MPDTNAIDEYKLFVKKIKLKEINISNEKIYQIIIYTQNKQYPEISDMKKINQFGRRLLSPWMAGENPECPKFLEIKWLFVK